MRHLSSLAKNRSCFLILFIYLYFLYFWWKTKEKFCYKKIIAFDSLQGMQRMNTSWLRGRRHTGYSK